MRNSISVPVPIHEPASTKVVTTVPEGSLHPILVVAGIQFLKMINGKAYPMAGKCLQIVKADAAPLPASGSSILSQRQ